VKLLLDPTQPTPLFVPQSQSTKKVLANLGKPPIDVATDYIGALYAHALAQIENAFFKDYVAMQQKKFVLTVPAVWYVGFFFLLPATFPISRSHDS
jgi:hypothetical protein